MEKVMSRVVLVGLRDTMNEILKNKTVASGDAKNLKVRIEKILSSGGCDSKTLKEILAEGGKVIDSYPGTLSDY